MFRYIAVLGLSLAIFLGLIGAGIGSGLVDKTTKVSNEVVRDAQAENVTTPTPAPQKPTPVPTPAPQKPSADNKGGPTVSCPTTGEIKGMLRIHVVREGTDPCGFEWTGVPFSTKVTIPNGFFATLHTTEKDAKGNDKIIFVDGDRTPRDFEIKAGTFRWKMGYPPGDPARDNACGLLAKEQGFGAGEVPTFGVEPFGFTCEQGSSGNPGTSGGTATADPSSVLGGTWIFGGGNRWTLAGAATIRGAAGWIIHTPNHPGDPGLPPGQSETTSVATAYKQ